MHTFNELLISRGIVPSDVALLRHRGKRGALNVTPYELWKRDDGLFDRYQSTQSSAKRIFECSNYWASFVSTPENETLFVGLYSATKGERSDINWECPLDGGAPGENKKWPSDLYKIELLDVLSDYQKKLTVDWHAPRAWVQYAAKNHHHIVAPPVLTFAASPEGKKRWVYQRKLERDPKLTKAAMKQNARENGGRNACQACDFQHDDRSLFDAHHLYPLQAGPRLTHITDLAVLCPTCHRRAHRSLHRMIPYSIEELQKWNRTDRP